MSDSQTGPANEANSIDQKRIEMEAVYTSARALVGDLIQSIETGGDGVRDLPASLATLHKIFVAVTDAETKFNEKFGTLERPGDFDFDAVREQIRSRLDRLRAAGATDGVSG